MREAKEEYREICELEGRKNYTNIVLRKSHSDVYEVSERLERLWFQFWKPKYSYRVIEKFTSDELLAGKEERDGFYCPPRVFLHYGFGEKLKPKVVFRFCSFYIDNNTLHLLSKELKLKIN